MRWSIWILCLLAIILMVSPTLAVQSSTPGGPGSPGATQIKINGDLAHPELLPLVKTDRDTLYNTDGNPYQMFKRKEISDAAFIKSATLNIREGPGTSHPILGKAKKGEFFKLLAEEGKWVKIDFKGQEAYAYANNVRIKRDGYVETASYSQYVHIPKKPPIWENWEPQQLLVGGVVILVVLFIVIASIRSTRRRRRDKESRDRRAAITLGNRHAD